MIRRALGALATLAALSVPAAAAAPAGAAAARVSVTGVTVTAAAAHGDSAISLVFVNHSTGPVSLTSITSSVAGRSMIDFDDNMCQGGTMMTWLGNILVPAGHTQLLGYRDQGAMLWKLDRALTVGARIPLTLNWTNFSTPTTVTLMARVVAPPKGIRFLMQPMAM